MSQDLTFKRVVWFGGTMMYLVIGLAGGSIAACFGFVIGALMVSGKVQDLENRVIGFEHAIRMNVDKLTAIIEAVRDLTVRVLNATSLEEAKMVVVEVDDQINGRIETFHG